MRTLSWLMGGLIAVTLFAACGFEDECEPFTHRCSGSQLQSCVGARTIIAGSRPIYEWNDGKHCAGLCVESGGEAVCVPQVDARCPSCGGDCEHGAKLCVGNSALDCDAKGRLLEESVCDVACVVGVSEVSQEPIALCALSPDPEPACEGRDRACVDGQMTSCEAGFVVERLDPCEPSQFCVQSETTALCALELSPNPSCAGLMGTYSTVCVDGITLWCHEGFVYNRGPAC